MNAKKSTLTTNENIVMLEKKFTKEASKQELSKALHEGSLSLKDFIKLRFEQIHAKLETKNQKLTN